MKIIVSLKLNLKSYIENANSDTSVIKEIPENTSIRRILEMLNIPKREVGLVVINNSIIGMDYIVKNGEEISFFPPIQGG